MATACFQREIQAQYVRPRIRFTYAGTDYSAYVKSISDISRDDSLSAQYVTVELSDAGKSWDALFREDHTELTKKVVISLAIGKLATITADTLSFHENAPSADTIEDSADGLGVFGEKAVLAITGSTDNNKSVFVETVADGSMTIDTSDDLTEEIAGDSVTITNELLPLFTGYVEKAEINYSDGSATLKCRDRMSLLLENRCEYYSGGQLLDIAINHFDVTGAAKYNAMPISTAVWYILTSTDLPGVLDATESTANPDIDYTSFTAWATAVDNGAYDLYDIGLFLSGAPQKKNVLLSVANMTVSQIWIGGDGKIKFKASTQTIAGNNYTKANVIGGFNMDIGIDRRINSYNVKWGYMPGLDTWLSDDSGIYAHSHLYGPTDVPYTYQSTFIQDRDAFHNTVASATKYVDEALLITAPPMRECRLGMNLYGFLEDVGNEIILDDFYVGSPYDAIEVHLEKIVFNVKDFIATLEGYYLWGGGELV